MFSKTLTFVCLLLATILVISDICEAGRYDDDYPDDEPDYQPDYGRSRGGRGGGGDDYDQGGDDYGGPSRREPGIQSFSQLKGRDLLQDSTDVGRGKKNKKNKKKNKGYNNANAYREASDDDQQSPWAGGGLFLRRK